MQLANTFEDRYSGLRKAPSDINHFEDRYNIDAAPRQIVPLGKPIDNYTAGRVPSGEHFRRDGF